MNTNQTFCVKSTRNVPYLGLKLYSILHCFQEIYAADKKFTRPPVPLVPPNINSVPRLGCEEL